MSPHIKEVFAGAVGAPFRAFGWPRLGISVYDDQNRLVSHRPSLDYRKESLGGARIALPYDSARKDSRLNV